MTSSSLRRTSRTGPGYRISWSELWRFAFSLMAVRTIDPHQLGIWFRARGRMSSNDASKIWQQGGKQVSGTQVAAQGHLQRPLLPDSSLPPRMPCNRRCSSRKGVCSRVWTRACWSRIASRCRWHFVLGLGKEGPVSMLLLFFVTVTKHSLFLSRCFSHLGSMSSEIRYNHRKVKKNKP